MSKILEKDRVLSYATNHANYIYWLRTSAYANIKFRIIGKKKRPNRWQPLLRKLYMNMLKIYREIAEDIQDAARQIWVQRMNDLLVLMPKHIHVEACACFCVRKAIRKGVEGLILPARLQAANKLIRK